LAPPGKISEKFPSVPPLEKILPTPILTNYYTITKQQIYFQTKTKTYHIFIKKRKVSQPCRDVLRQNANVIPCVRVPNNNATSGTLISSYKPSLIFTARNAGHCIALKRSISASSIRVKKTRYERCAAWTSVRVLPGFFYGVSGTRFGFLELKIGSLESEKINVGSLESEKIGSLESEKTGSLQVHTGDLTFSLKKTWYYNNSF